MQKKKFCSTPSFFLRTPEIYEKSTVEMHFIHSYTQYNARIIIIITVVIIISCHRVIKSYCANIACSLVSAPPFIVWTQ